MLSTSSHVALSALFVFCSFFFFTDTATTEIYTLSLHDALPICALRLRLEPLVNAVVWRTCGRSGIPWPQQLLALDRKSTRLNSSHTVISYAVFCLKKKKKKTNKR